MYYFLLIFLYPVSLLPLNILYRISDVAYVLIYHILKYRRHIVRENLLNAFPEKDIEEIKKIKKIFFRSFCDQWIETIKLISITERELNKRIIGNWEVFEKFNREGRNVFALLGHQFNWEWANVACQYNSKQQFAAIYLPQKNKSFDKLLLKIRSRSKSLMIAANDLKSSFKLLSNMPHIIGFMADQSPATLRIAKWYKFMNRDAPFFNGPEKMAIRNKVAVVFAGIKRLKRGYYQVHLSIICDNAHDTCPGLITGKYVSLLEQEIKAQPHNWLWSHRRWKRTKPLSDD